MSGEQRLDRLYPALTAKERGLLVLQAYKAGEQPDRLIYSTTPSAQGREFNRYIRLMNAVNTEVAYALMLLNGQVRQIDIKYGWLMSLLLWGLEIDSLGGHLLKATQDRALRRDVRKMMKHAPGALRVPVDLSDPQTHDPFEAGYGRGLVVALLTGIKEGTERHWRELRSVEIAVAEVTDAEFDGEALLQPDVQASLDEAKGMLVAVHEGIVPYVDPFELSEPSDEDVELVRKLIAKAADQ
jgi:hypothetical protein